MEVLFTKQFARDIQNLKNKSLAEQIEKVIFSVKQATSPQNIVSLKKLRGSSNAYRIRIGDYRIGLFILGDTIEFCRIMKRSELYKYFP